MNLKIVDHILSQRALEHFDKALTKRPWFLGHDGGERRNFSLGLSIKREHFGEQELYFLSSLKEHGVDIGSIKRCYYNCFRKGDKPRYHTDHGRQTYIFYLNKKWNRSWGASTKFKERKFHMSRSIFPKPGRLIIFDSNIWHKGTAPNILMPDKIAGRMSIAFHEDFPKG